MTDRTRDGGCSKTKLDLTDFILNHLLQETYELMPVYLIMFLFALYKLTYRLEIKAASQTFMSRSAEKLSGSVTQDSNHHLLNSRVSGSIPQLGCMLNPS